MLLWSNYFYSFYLTSQDFKWFFLLGNTSLGKLSNGVCCFCVSHQWAQWDFAFQWGNLSVQGKKSLDGKQKLKTQRYLIFQNYFGVELLDGHLLVHLDLGNGPLKIKGLKEFLHDGKWHNIKVTLLKNQVMVDINGDSETFEMIGNGDCLPKLLGILSIFWDSM